MACPLRPTCLSGDAQYRRERTAPTVYNGRADVLVVGQFGVLRAAVVAIIPTKKATTTHKINRPHPTTESAPISSWRRLHTKSIGPTTSRMVRKSPPPRESHKR
jgi:hypothetical protein